MIAVFAGVPVDFIEKQGTDMRPDSLVKQMEADDAARQGNSKPGAA